MRVKVTSINPTTKKEETFTYSFLAKDVRGIVSRDGVKYVSSFVISSGFKPRLIEIKDEKEQPNYDLMVKEQQEINSRAEDYAPVSLVGEGAPEEGIKTEEPPLVQRELKPINSLQAGGNQPPKVDRTSKPVENQQQPPSFNRATKPDSFRTHVAAAAENDDVAWVTTTEAKRLAGLAKGKQGGDNGAERK